MVMKSGSLRSGPPHPRPHDINNGIAGRQFTECRMPTLDVAQHLVDIRRRKRESGGIAKRPEFAGGIGRRLSTARSAQRLTDPLRDRHSAAPGNAPELGKLSLIEQYLESPAHNIENT
jgi:hypothetical protein